MFPTVFNIAAAHGVVAADTMNLATTVGGWIAGFVLIGGIIGIVTSAFKQQIALMITSIVITVLALIVVIKPTILADFAKSIGGSSSVTDVTTWK